MTNTTEITTLLNPYSIRLEKEPFMRVEGKPIFVNGDFRIYKYCTEHYIHTFKNIVISQRVAPKKEILTNVMGETMPTGDAAIYHDLERPKEAMKEGIRAAKKLNFKIV